jgi:hypothetical protein
VFSADEDPQVKDALAPFVALRASQVPDPCRLKELVIGCPSKIPFGFCRELLVGYG